jgi:hypothetical protein
MGLSVLIGIGLGCSPEQTEFRQSKPISVHSLAELLALQPEAIAQLDIARMNLLCAEGLPGAGRLDLAASLAVVEQMAARAQMETARHRYRFEQQPGEFEHSEGFFRMMMLMVVLAEDFKVHYAPDKIASAAQARHGDGFFANAADVFLPGLTGVSRRGTCSSLPVLYVALGRRLGYPLKFVTTKGHASSDTRPLRIFCTRPLLRHNSLTIRLVVAIAGFILCPSVVALGPPGGNCSAGGTKLRRCLLDRWRDGLPNPNPELGKVLVKFRSSLSPVMVGVNVHASRRPIAPTNGNAGFIRSHAATSSTVMVKRCWSNFGRGGFKIRCSGGL